MRTNLVGRSCVSAITQTPASGPLGPVTTPARAAGPIGIVWAARGQAGRFAARPTIITWTKQRRIVFIWPSGYLLNPWQYFVPPLPKGEGDRGEDLPSHPSLMVVVLRGDPRLGR